MKAKVKRTTHPNAQKTPHTRVKRATTRDAAPADRALNAFNESHRDDATTPRQTTMTVVSGGNGGNGRLRCGIGSGTAGAR